MKNKIVIIGGGISSLSAASYLAKAGNEVTVLEKNNTVGGRARQLVHEGFTFDIGPTFYWMPDVFERFFNDFGKKAADFYQLNRLSPAYQVYFGEQDSITIDGSFEKIKATFEQVEKGSSAQLAKFMANAESNYNIAIKDLVYRPGESIFEIVTPQTIGKLGQFIKTIKQQVSEYISHPKLQKILEFPVLFLGAKPSNTPSFYNFMNYADFVLGTWHPQGGMYEVIKAMRSVAETCGVRFITDQEVKSFDFVGNRIAQVKTDTATYPADIVLSGADYAHTETLLSEKFRQYTDAYWNKKTFAPSALLFYVGFDKKLANVSHHTLFFDTDFELHAKTIYDTKQWPEDPLFYASFPSITDAGSAPEGKENGIFLIPIAPGITDTPDIRKKYFDLIISRLEKLTGQSVKSSILFEKSYCLKDFVSDYNSYKGNAYGLANTLFQTHILRPKMKSKKLANLYFTGQLTVPGPGVPPSIISGKVVSTLIEKHA